MKLRALSLLLLAPLLVVGCGASRVIPLEAGSFRYRK